MVWERAAVWVRVHFCEYLRFSSGLDCFLTGA